MAWRQIYHIKNQPWKRSKERKSQRKRKRGNWQYTRLKIRQHYSINLQKWMEICHKLKAINYANLISAPVDLEDLLGKIIDNATRKSMTDFQDTKIKESFEFLEKMTKKGTRLMPGRHEYGLYPPITIILKLATEQNFLKNPEMLGIEPQYEITVAGDKYSSDFAVCDYKNSIAVLITEAKKSQKEETEGMHQHAMQLAAYAIIRGLSNTFGLFTTYNTWYITHYDTTTEKFQISKMISIGAMGGEIAEGFISLVKHIRAAMIAFYLFNELESEIIGYD
eukprot:TRINITY_DN1880_c0_g1_i1.p1 TRINITY_DN1880_c0_g1~~TRINITY_DN1880_c0_g1_i1.p1  ORF type:complete len:279 (-),score=11.93 TRINITY_DN1880_c0_g1_i1:207-1043(-)